MPEITSFVPKFRIPEIREFTSLSGEPRVGLLYALTPDEITAAELYQKISWSTQGKAEISTQPVEYCKGYDSDACMKGKMAEIAAGILFQTEVDIARIFLGDQSLDVMLDGKKVDVKTKDWKYGALWNHKLFITHHDATGYHNKLDAEYYISSLVVTFSREERKAEIIILGYQTGDYIKNHKTTRSPRGTHYNIEWNATDVMSIEDLI